MVPIHPVVLEKKFVLHISHRVAVKLCPPLVAILDFQLVQRETTLGKQLAMIIHDNFQFHPPCSIGEDL
jgi:hypothetical protein